MSLMALHNASKGIVRSLLHIGDDNRDTTGVTGHIGTISTTMTPEAPQPETRPPSRPTSHIPKPAPAFSPNAAENDWIDVLKGGAQSQALVSSLQIANDNLREDNQRQRRNAQKSSYRASQLQVEKNELLECLNGTKLAHDQLKKSTEAAVKIATEKISALENRLRELDAQARSDRRDFLAARSQLLGTTRALEACKLKQQETDGLLEVRTAELRDAQATLGNLHIISHSDVKRMVDNLNAEVFQMSALISDHFPFEQKHSSQHMELCRVAYDRISEMVGQGIAHAVTTCSHGDDSALVQVIIQAYVVGRISWAVEMWSFTIDPALMKIFRDLYESIFSEESQSTSARWRSITKRHLNRDIDRQLVETSSDSLAAGLVDILVVAGVPLSARKISDKVHDCFGERIATIVAQTMELRKVIGVDVMDSEFEILRPYHGASFQRDLMENMEEVGSGRGAAKTQDGELVLCTTELGLLRVEKKVDGGGRENIEQNVLMKAKVALDTIVEEFAKQQKENADGSACATPGGEDVLASLVQAPGGFCFGSTSLP